MKPKVASILKHIIDSLFVIVLAAIVVLVTWAVGQLYCEKLIIWVAQVEFLILAFAVIATSGVLRWNFPKEMFINYENVIELKELL